MIITYCFLIAQGELRLDDILHICVLPALGKCFFLLCYIVLGLLNEGRDKRLLHVEDKRHTEEQFLHKVLLY